MPGITHAATPANKGDRVDATQRFPVGTKYARIGEPQDKENPWTVVNFLVTKGLEGNIVQARYMATKMFMGRAIVDRDVLETTIARGLIG